MASCNQKKGNLKHSTGLIIEVFDDDDAFIVWILLEIKLK